MDTSTFALIFGIFVLYPGLSGILGLKFFSGRPVSPWSWTAPVALLIWSGWALMVMLGQIPEIVNVIYTGIGVYLVGFVLAGFWMEKFYLEPWQPSGRFTGMFIVWPYTVEILLGTAMWVVWREGRKLPKPVKRKPTPAPSWEEVRDER